MIKSKKLQKFIGIFVAVAVLASMTVASLTLSSASSEEVWSLVDDATTDETVSWHDFATVGGLRGSYKELSNLTEFTAGFTSDEITFTNFKNGSSAMFGWAGKTFFTVEEGYTLDLNLRYDTPNNVAWSWKVELHDKNGDASINNAYIDISEAIAESAGIPYSQWGLSTTGKDVVASVDLAEAIGEGTQVDYIRIYLAFASQSNETTFTVKDFTVTKPNDTPSSSGSETQPSGDVVYTAPISDASKWLTSPWPGVPATDETSVMEYEVSDGSISFNMKDSYKGPFYPYAKIVSDTPLVENLTTDHYINYDFNLVKGTSDTTYVAVALLFGDGGSTSVNISQMFGDAWNGSAANGVVYGEYGNVSINIAEAVRTCSAANYDAIFGANPTLKLTGIQFTLTTGTKSIDSVLTINDVNITDGQPKAEPETLYAAGMDSLTNWLTYDTANTSNAYLAPIGDGTDPNYTGHMKGEVLDDGIKFTFTDTFYGAKEATNAYGSFVRQFKAVPGLCTVDNNSYMNLHFKLESDSSLYGAQLYVRVGPSGDQDVTSVIADLFDLETVTVSGVGADGSTPVSYDTLPAGEYTISISFADMLKNYPDQLALLENGAPLIYHQLFVRADDSCAEGDDVALTVYDVSVTTVPTYENAYDDLKDDTSSSEAPSSSETTSSSTPSEPSDTTGEIRWEAPLTDASKWIATPWPGYALDSADSAAYITYEIGEDGSLKLGFPDGATIAYPYAKIQDINGLLELTEDDVLNIDVSWHQGNGETEGAIAENQNMKVELLFGELTGTNGVNAQYAVQIGKAITDAATDSGSILNGDYKASINIKDAVQKCATADVYNAIFGEGGDSTLKGIRFTINSNGTPIDTTAYAVIRELNITDGEPSSEPPASSSETPSSSETTSPSSSETSTSSSASTTTSTTTSAASTTSNGSSVAQVDTGEAFVPIIAVTALAVVSASAVVISKKRSK